MSSTSPEWSAFRLGIFGKPYLVWHNGPDFTAFDALWDISPVFVETALADGLRQRDPLAAQAIARLPPGSGSRAGFVTLLTRCLGARPVGFHLRVAEALFHLTGDEHWSDEVLRVLLGAGYWSDRFDAAIALRVFRPTPAIIDALTTCVTDPDYLVRFHASNTLLDYAGQKPDVTLQNQLFVSIRSRSTPADWSVAARTLGEGARSTLPS